MSERALGASWNVHIGVKQPDTRQAERRDAAAHHDTEQRHTARRAPACLRQPCQLCDRLSGARASMRCIVMCDSVVATPMCESECLEMQQRTTFAFGMVLSVHHQYACADHGSCAVASRERERACGAS